MHRPKITNRLQFSKLSTYNIYPPRIPIRHVNLQNVTQLIPNETTTNLK